MVRNVIFIIIVIYALNFPAILFSSDGMRSTNENNTLGSDLGISSGDCISRVVIYAFQGDFQTPFIGNKEQDNFYNLLRGEKVDLSRFPHKILTEQTEIKILAGDLLCTPCIGKSENRNPDLPGRFRLFVHKDLLQVAKSTPEIVGLIIIHINDRNPILIWHNTANQLVCDGKIYKSNMFDQDTKTSYYMLLFEEIKESKPFIQIFY